jgi:protoporphyrinogen/coproporphyrinogen III oxidase
VAVVGGGISGLAAAWELHPHSDVWVYEAERLGGKILTEPFEGRDVECGPDAFISRTPDAVGLCAELGLDDLTAPQAGGTLLWWRGRLRNLPEGLVLGAPKRLRPLITSGLLSPAGLLRASADLFLPRHPIDADVSVRALIAARFGSEVADRLVDPLVGGIHAGRTEELSSMATVPQLVEVARRSRSLLLGLRRTPTAAAGPAFLTPRLGLASLVGRLVQRLQEAGVQICHQQVTGLTRDGHTWRVQPADESFDAVVLATNAVAASHILGGNGPGGLRQIPAASVALVTLGYGPIAVPPGVNGVLVPRSAGWLMTACSFGSAKWPQWANPNRTVLRVSTGRDGDHRAFRLDDEQLVAHLADEVGTALGMTDQPDTWRVNRWLNSFPQYRVGHPARVAEISDTLRRTHPMVHVCGASYHGAGIPACISSGRAAARSVRQAALDRG